MSSNGFAPPALHHFGIGHRPGGNAPGRPTEYRVRVVDRKRGQEPN